MPRQPPATPGDPDAAATGTRPGSNRDVLFDGAEILARHRVDRGGVHAQAVTMRRDAVTRNELQTDRHALFVGVHGDRHHATVKMDGLPSWSGVKGPGRSAFCAAGRRVVALHGRGLGTTLVLFFGDATIEGLLHRPQRLAWHSRPSAEDPFIVASSVELAQALADSLDDLALLWAEAVAANLVIHSARRFSDLAAPRTGKGGGIDRALGLIHDMLPAAASLDQLAQASGLSPARLLSGFKARTGTTPHQYIVQERIGRARKLLRTTNLTVASVSAAVGCANAEHLGRMFRQHVGLSPQAWRRLHGRP